MYTFTNLSQLYYNKSKDQYTLLAGGTTGNYF